MINDRTAILSDIHGNLWALEKVLADIKSKRVKKIVNLGDSLYGPLKPAKTADILMELNIPTVCGNEDSIIVESFPGKDISPTLAYVRSCLSTEHIFWLKSLPKTTSVYGQLFLCHGTPQSSNQYMLHSVLRSGIKSRPAKELLSLVNSVKEPVVLCGHDHFQQDVLLSDSKLILNPGSVGLQAYTDTRPYPHAIEMGSPHARYSILIRDSDHWRVEKIAIPYDWEKAASQAIKNGRSDWAVWLRTGRVADRR